MIYSQYIALRSCTELLYSLLNDYKYDTIYIFPVTNNDSLLGFLYNKNLETLVDSILNRACEINSISKQLDLWYKNCDELILPNINYSKKDKLIKYLLQKFDTKTGLNFGNLDRHDIRQIIVDRINLYFKTLKHSNSSVEYSSIYIACEDIKALLQSIIANMSKTGNDELVKVTVENAKKAIEYLDSRVVITDNYWS